ncbi:hypothetical protein ABZP36_032479 [Zizania latifolia]
MTCSMSPKRWCTCTAVPGTAGHPVTPSRCSTVVPPRPTFVTIAFLDEIEKTVALLVFEDIKNCPYGELLDVCQRLKTASEVNAAILISQSHEKGGIIIEEGTAGAEGKTAQNGMRGSLFCLSPAGDTPSSARLFDAIVSSCIPVIISDELELPFEGILDYRKGRGGPGMASNVDAQKQSTGTSAVGDTSLHQPVGLPSAIHAASVMAIILGGAQTTNVQNGFPVQYGLGNDPLTHYLARMSRHQLYEIMSELKAQIMLGMVTSQMHVEVLIPAPKDGGVLINMEAGGINTIDWKLQKGMLRPFLPKKFPFVPENNKMSDPRKRLFRNAAKTMSIAAKLRYE